MDAEQDGLRWKYWKIKSYAVWEERVNNREKGFPAATTQIGKKIPVIEEVPAQDFRDAEDDVSVFPCNFFQPPPSKF